MKIVILGSGVIGVTAAWYLARDGHEVTVLDRCAAPGMETSFANAGEISPGYAAPWAGPGMAWKAIRWMASRHSPLVIRPRLDIDMIRWLYRMLRNCNQAAYAVNKERMVRIATYSRACLEDLRAETGIAYDQRTLGTLQLFRDQKSLDDAAKDVAVLQQEGIDHALLDRQGCLAVEPGLRPVADKVAGGLHLPGDETGDCQMFTAALAAMAADRGVAFRQDVTITRLEANGDRIARVITDHGDFAADAYVVALGSYSPMLLRPLGIRTQIYPVKGYSLTMPIVDEAASPVSTIMDEQHKVAITRLGDRIRAAGTAELTGYDLSLSRGRCAMLMHVVRDLFPMGGDFARVGFWTGLRPMVPDGGPLVGPTRFDNLWLDTGHGTLGWTMACGSGAVLTDLIAHRTPAISTDDLAIGRFPPGQGV